MPIAKLSGSFDATGQSTGVISYRYFNVSIQGDGAGTVNLQRSFDGGSTWETVESFTAITSKTYFEPEKGVQYRFDCSTYTSGTFTYRIGSSGSGS